jgi:outer membrane protein OmpA-like peptidoglycan-associated protein
MVKNIVPVFAGAWMLISTIQAQQPKLIIKETDSTRIEIEALGAEINSKFNDYAPVITADGLEMFYTSRRPVTDKEKKKGTEVNERIFYSSFDEETGKWSEAEPLGETVNVPGRHNSNIAISNDGQRLLIYQDSKWGDGEIFESYLKGRFWSSPTPISTVINTESHESSATISPDGRTIYFVSDRKGGQGKRDIWKCTKGTDGNWGVPENLGKVVNTKEDEEAVFMHPDGKTLYFSSKGHKGFGGYDIYKTVYNKGKWSSPVNLGEPINTNGDDLFFVLAANGKVGYYASSRDSDVKNIYEIRFITKENVKEEQPNLAVIKGTIRDGKSNLPIGATIVITDNEKNEIVGTYTSNSETGKYLISLPSGKNYGISVTAPGYLFHSDNVTSDEDAKYQEIKKDIGLVKLETGSQIVLRNIFFDYNKYSLKEESKTELDRVLQLMEDNPTLVIEIGGHTDTQGSADYNQKLSEDRAKAVVDYLVAYGIPRDRFAYKGYGKSKPLISDTEIAKLKTPQEKEDAHGMNRRTEFKILKN